MSRSAEQWPRNSLGVVHQNARSSDAGLQALSISHWVWLQLQASTFHARVLAVFERACSLVTADGSVSALVLPHLGNGPLNIVVDGSPGDFASIEPGKPARLVRDSLQVGKISVPLANASVWDPRPDWHGLRDCCMTGIQQLPYLYTTALQYAPEGSLLALLPSPLISANAGPWSGRSNQVGGTACSPSKPSGESQAMVLLAAARTGARAVQKGWRGDAVELEKGSRRLAGLGGGLTPAGDDFLAGVMLWAWLAHPTPQRLGHSIVEAAAGKTTRLSAAFLRAAERGHCSDAWHRLLAALAKGGEEDLAQATLEVLSHGHTSGADVLAGFLWMERGSVNNRATSSRGIFAG